MAAPPQPVGKTAPSMSGWRPGHVLPQNGLADPSIARQDQGTGALDAAERKAEISAISASRPIGCGSTFHPRIRSNTSAIEVKSPVLQSVGRSPKPMQSH